MDVMISRRKFLISATGIGSTLGATLALSRVVLSDRLGDLIRKSPRARYWTSTAVSNSSCVTCHTPETKLRANVHAGQPAIVKCLLCAQGCVLKSGERGKCRARMNINGEMRTLVYGRPVAVHVDPIEKKPFYHFLPGSNAFSFATSGCPLHCKFCQNWEISQSRPEDFDTRFVKPAEMVNSAAVGHSPIIAFTYNEPTVFMEYLADTATLARKRKLRSVLVSCGFMKSEPLSEMCHLLDAIKIDLKGFSPDFYRTVCSAELQPVLNTIKQIAKSGVHLEIVNLVVPTLNDSEKMMYGLVDWIIGEIGPDVPIHFTRFHPDYQLLNLPPTPVATLERFRDRALSKGIHYPYIGNVPGHPGNNTYCPQCGKVIIQRISIFITGIHMEHGHCKFCGKAIAGVWQ
jgi:pyruvate formate lyase activating enzyme